MTHNAVAKVERLLHEVGAGPAGKESATDPETAVDDFLGVADVLDDDDEYPDGDVPEGHCRRGRRGRAGRSQTRLRDRPGVVRSHVVDDRAQVLERVASEMGRLGSCNKGEEAPVRAVPRKDRRGGEASPAPAAEESLEEEGRARRRGGTEPEEHCSAHGRAVDRTKDAEEAIGRVLAEPAVKSRTRRRRRRVFPSCSRVRRRGDCLVRGRGGGERGPREPGDGREDACILANSQCWRRWTRRCTRLGRASTDPASPTLVHPNRAARDGGDSWVGGANAGVRGERILFRESAKACGVPQRWNLARINVRMGEIVEEMTSFLDDFSLVRAVEGQTGGFAAATAATWKARRALVERRRRVRPRGG